MDYYDIRGKEDSRSILFIHGAGVTRTWWHPQMEYFSKGFRAIALDLPGHGVLSNLPFRIDTALDRISSLVEEEIPGRVLLVGSSLGGYLAISYAGSHPEHVAGLHLSGSAINMNGVRGIGFRLTGRMLKRKGPDWLRRVTIEGYQQRVEDSIINPVIENGVFAKAAVEAFSQLSGHDFHRMLGTYPGPVMIANGENDEANRDAEKALKRKIGRIIISPIQDASHLANLEQPTAYNESVESFARGISWR